MSSFVFMKVLESAPDRYDQGIRRLSRGRIDAVYEAVADRAAGPGRRLLDVGCGTGGVALACAARGASVVGIDANPAMLEVAREKARATPAGASVEWVELGATEIEDRFPEAGFDAVTACLSLSEMDPAEQDYVLRTALSRLKPGGRLVIADEVAPPPGWRRVAYRLRRAPRVVLTYLLTQATTRPVADVEARIAAAGFVDVHVTRLWSGEFVIVEARRGEG